MFHVVITGGNTLVSYTVQSEGEKIQPGSPNILADVLWTGYNLQAVEPLQNV